MNSQMLIGGRKIEDTPQFRSALQEQQKIIREQYERKFQEIEKERNAIEEDKAQVDRYKQLLLKQRDIMIALTTRLNERDETIIQLQEELDAYDRIHKETEDMLENKNEAVIILESFLKERNIPLPYENVFYRIFFFINLIFLKRVMEMFLAGIMVFIFLHYFIIILILNFFFLFKK